jgi:hypothetical protein
MSDGHFNRHHLNCGIHNWDYWILLLMLFLIGIFLGKVLTLYDDRKLSNVLKIRMKNITTRINSVIGVLSVCVSISQFTKLFYY